MEEFVPLNSITALKKLPLLLKQLNTSSEYGAC